MTDINQWRRMIQSSRARTPAIEGDDIEAFLSPTTPRNALKPKLAPHFTQHMNSSFSSKTESPFGGDDMLPGLPSWSISIPTPNAESLIESVMCRLLATPHQRLDSSYNGTLLQIFECFRRLSDEKDGLRSSLQQEVERRSTIEQAMHQSAEQWNRERHEYKAEVKRLEIILAKGERGVAEVTLARQGSVLRRRRQDGNGRGDKTLETIFQLLERSRRHDEKLWGSQRATMRKRTVSPSAGMRRLSRQLMSEPEATVLLHDLLSDTLGKATLLAQQTTETSSMGANRHIRDSPTIGPAEVYRQALGTKADHSNDSLSTFSCDGDLLPDETSDLELITVAGTDNDFVAMKRIAQVLARRRQIDPNDVMPKLTQLFKERPARRARRTSLMDESHLSRPAPVAAERSAVRHGLAKHPTLKAKASEFFSKWKPHLSVDTSSPAGRRFSFEPGDDTDAACTTPSFEHMSWTVKERLLRRSVSMSILTGAELGIGKQIPSTLPPSVQSPSSPAPHCESKRPSRIPTPVYSAASLARPRSEREDSAASLLTAIKLDGDESPRSASFRSSTHSSPVANQLDLVHNIDDPVETRLIISNPLLERTNALRGSALAAAAARVASTATANTGTDTARLKHPRMPSQSSNRSSRSQPVQDTRVHLGMAKSRVENGDPIRLSTSSCDEQGSNASL